MKSGAAIEEGSWSPALRVGSKWMRLREVGRCEWWEIPKSLSADFPENGMV